MIVVGFSGTQLGMSPVQQAKFLRLMYTIKPEQFHHGDCIGSDAEAHRLIRRNFPDCKIHIHPPDNPEKRAWCEGDFVCAEQPYLERNRDIVKCASKLVAAPKEMAEIMRSGTWSTIRYGRLVLPKHSIWIVYPNGIAEQE